MGGVIVIALFGTLFMAWAGWGVYLFKDELKSILPSKPKKAITAGNTKKRSQAFVEGYADMGIFGAGIPKTHIIQVRDDRYNYIDVMVDKRVKTIKTGKNNEPYFPETYMDQVARLILDSGKVIDMNKGQVDEDYLGGTKEEFEDYYAGGMKFLADVDDRKGKVINDRLVIKNKKDLAKARKQGLTEINKTVAVDMAQLDEIRMRAFETPASAHEKWEKEMKELGQ